ncbi:hypothetical protein [Arcobacter sp.]|uniref:capsular polysaccharide export protein, LipB/KpsS family n=1 Tax=unclassified Arcobacter TaxID=2593671 RepID=UPI003B00BC00
MMIQNTEKLIQNIKKHDGIIVFCGASLRTKFLIENYELFSNIDYIFDNNKKEESFLSIPIIDFLELQKLKNALIIICGNHSFEIYKQLSNLKNKLLIESRQISRFFPKDFFFEVETPDFQAKNGKDSSHAFLPLLLEELLKFNQKIITVPTEHNDENYFRKRQIKENSLLFSYHSFGKNDPNKIHFKEGYFFDIINIDNMGYSGWSSLCCDKNELNEIEKVDINKAQKDFLFYKEKYIDKNLSKYIQPHLKEEKLPDNFIFIPLQVFDDSVMKKAYFEPIIWIKRVVELLNKKNISIVIKRHPRCFLKEVDSLINEFKKNNNITIYEGSIHIAIKKSMAVYTINSGVGFESLFHLKPVVTFGEVDYQSATFNIKDFKDLEDNLIPKLTNKNIEYIKKFISYFMERKNINITDKENISYFVDNFVMAYLDKRLKEIYG